jgi:Cu+-exporting ATPase
MQVDEGSAAGKSEHAGRTYYFCSAGCKQKFDSDPENYSGGGGGGQGAGQVN